MTFSKNIKSTRLGTPSKTLLEVLVTLTFLVISFSTVLGFDDHIIPIDHNSQPLMMYCASASNNFSDEYISNVSIESINNTSAASNYTDFTALSTDLEIGTTYSISITPTWTGTVYNEGYAVWIDFNGDLDFDDPGENVVSIAANQNTPNTASFVIPNDAVPGSTRMRVSMKYNGIPTSCENTFAYGEVEDYSINITGESNQSTCYTECANPYVFNWYDGSIGAQWPITNGEATVSNVYTISGDQGDYKVTVTLNNPDGQNIDFSNCTTTPDAAYTATCNDPNGNTECDGDPNTNDTQFTYGCSFFTFGVTSDNSDQITSITYNFEYPVYLCDFEISDIDFTLSSQLASSYQDEVDVTADSLGIPVILSAVTGSAVDVFNNNTPNIKLLADYDNVSGGDVLPTDPIGRANVSSLTRVTSVTFTYSNGPEDDGLSDDHAIRLDGFSFCPTLQEICGNGVDDDGDGLVDCFDPHCQDGINVNAETNNNEICAGESVTLTATHTSLLTSISYSWSNGAGNNQSATVSPAVTTTYTVTATNINGCSATDQVTITVNSNPNAGLTNNGPFTCVQSSVVMTATPAGMNYLWGNGSTGQTRTVSSTGSYSVTVTDSNGCSDVANTTVSNDFTTPTANAGANEIICNGSSINLTATGGGTYSWSNSLGSNATVTVSPSISTTYSVTVTASNGCTDADQVTITVNSNPSAGLTNNGPITCAQPSVVMTATPAGMNYLWGNGSTGQTRTVTSAGLYSVTVTDGNGCSDVANTSVSDNLTTPTASAGSDDVICNGSSTNLTATGGGTYAWSNSLGSNASVTVSPSSTTTYTVTVTAANGCTDTDDVLITVNPLPIANISGNSNICEFDVATYTADNAGASATYSWSFGADASPSTATGIGPHNVTYTNTGVNGLNKTNNVTLTVTLNGCINTDVESFTIYKLPSVTISSVSPSCGVDNGSITFTFPDNPSRTNIEFSLDGGNSYPYDVSDNIGTSTIGSLASDTYDLYVRWGNSECPVDLPDVTLLDNTVPVASAGSDDDICNGSSTNLTATGGGVYAWSNSLGSNSTVTVSPSSTTTYTVTVTAANGCTDTDQVTITVNSNPIAGLTNNGPITCAQPNVVMTATPAGMNYLWSNGSTGQTRTVSSTGSYSVTVTDGNGCSDVANTTVSDDLTPPVASAGSDDAICNGSSTNLTATGGGTYAWSNSLGSNSTVTVSPSSTTTYTVTVTAANGCTDTDQVTITVNSNPIAGLTNNGPITCAQPNVVMTATPAGMSYLWSNGSTGQTRTVSSTGSYSVTVTNGNGCSDVANTTVSDDLTPPVASAGSDDAICNGSSINLTASGVGTYSWSNSLGSNTTITVSPSSTTTYTVTVTAANGCTDTDQVTITVNSNPIAGLTNNGPITCAQPNVVMTATPAGMNYLWGNGSTGQTRTVSSTGSYSVTVTDGNGCSDVANTTVSDDLTPPVASAGSDDAICNGSSTNLTASGVGTYSWSNSLGSNATVTVSPSSTTTYTVTVTAANGCTDTDQVTITVNSNPIAGLTNNGPITCAQPNVVMTATPAGMNYLWGNGSTGQTRTVSSTGSYSVTVTDGNGCSDVANTTVSDDLTPPVASAGSDDAICNGSSINLTASGVGTYSWSNSLGSNATVTVSPSSTTTYTVTVTAANGCTDTDQVTITVNSNPIAGLTNNGPITCAQPNVVMTATPAGMNYLWGNGSTGQTRTVSSTGLYSVTVTDGNGCSDIANTTVSDDLTPPTASVSSDETICNESSTDLTASGGGTYAWSNSLGSNATVTVSPSSTTTYTVTVTAANGCTDTDDVTITVNSLPNVICQYEIAGESVVSGDCTVDVCEGEGLVLSADPNFMPSYIWSGPNGFSGSGNNLGRITLSNNLTVSHSGDYTVTVTDGNGCTGTSTITVNVNPLPIAVINNDGPITCDDGTVTLTATLSGANYLWSTGESSQSIDVITNGDYSVTITDVNGCVNSTVTTVTTAPPPVANVTGPVDICIGETTTLTPNTGGEWSSSNESVAIVSNSGNVVGVSGGFAVFTFEDTSTGCTDVSDTIHVSPEMSIIIDYIGGICLNDDSQLGVNITGGTPNYTYLWSGPSSLTSTNAIIDITESGNYYVTVTDAFGCEESTSGYIYQRYEPYIFSLNTEVCEGEMVDLSINSSTAVSYMWSANAGSNSTSAVTVTPSPPSTTYTVTITNDLGCESEATVTIDVNPKTTVAVTGPSVLCEEETTTLSPSSGGVWTSTNSSLATVTPDGIVTAVSEGSVSFIFIDSIYSCSSDPTTAVTIIGLPNPVFTGPTVLCVGGVTNLTPSTGGEWTSSDTLVATIRNDGQVTAIGEGTVRFTFENTTTGCVSNVSGELTIHPIYPVLVTGDRSICVGENTYLTPTTGGKWVSSDTDVATISNIGVVTGVGGGSVYFIFESDFNCVSPQSTEVIVTAYTDMTLSGPTTICEGTSENLTASMPNGVWSSSNSSIVSINAATGEIYGVAEGVATITYSQDANLCINDATREITILSKPSANITGAVSLCVGDISNVISTTNGGTWSSTDNLVAVVSDAGVVIGVNAGEAAFIYEGANGCFSDTTAFITVHPEITVDISFNGGICLEDDTKLSALVTGGSPGFNYTWSGPGGFTSSNQTIDVPLSGNYTIVVVDSEGCSAQYSAFVYERYEPFIFTLNTEVCEGESVTLSINGSEGGSYQWSTNAGGVTAQTITVTAPVPSATYVVTVTNDIGCTTVASATIDVNPTPTIMLTGNDSICNGSSTILTSSTIGTWTSSNYSVASINNNGLVIGINPGTAVFTFRDDNTGCYSDESEVITITPNAPISIMGDDDICLGIPKTLTATESGGTWSSSNNLIATVNSGTGEVTPVNAGSVVITYSIPEPLCFADGVKNITIRNLPSVNINGPALICEGDVTYLIPTSGGTWTSSNESVATVSNIGIVTGISGGASNFTFTSDYGCVQALGTAITVVAEPQISNSGPSELCINEMTTLTSNVNGLWVSSNSQVASVNSQGIVIGKTAGSADFTFIEFTNGCQGASPISIIVNGVPSINGLSTPSICIGESASITPNIGGYWTSSDTLIATISDGGIIAGVGAGAATFTYEDATTGCKSVPSNSITIEGKPLITLPGTQIFCVGETTSILPSTGGQWSSSDVSIATIDNQGNITAVSAGTVDFTFTNLTTGCISDPSADFIINNPTTASIVAPSGLCIDETSLLVGSEAGSWSSNNDAIGTVNNSGQFSAIAPGIVTITLNTFETCVENPTIDIQVNPAPITSFLGSSAICIGSMTNLSPLTGGTWDSSNEGVATVSDNGIVTALSAGFAVFTYTDTVTMCTATTSTSLNVFGKPDILIAGDSEICIGGSTSMSPSTGGFWTSTNELVATISTTGLVTGISAGQATFIFTEINTECISDASSPISVLPKPTVSITGDTQVCQGESSQLFPSTGGSWVSDNEAVAIVTNEGLVTGLSQGIVRFTFITNAGCASNKTNPIIVFGEPSVFVSDANLCINENIQISPNSGGVWVSSDDAIATITDQGVITGLTAGDVSFMFTDTITGCSSSDSEIITVHPIPTIDLNGPSEICAGSTTNLVPTTGGVWESLNPDIAAIGNDGIVTGVSEGSARFIFTKLTTGCSSDTSDFVTVTAAVIPLFIGNTEICIGDTSYISPSTGGTWISTNEEIATINDAGMIIGVGQGTAKFQFQQNGANCFSELSSSISINGMPTVSNSGALNICIGTTTQLFSTTTGSWESLQPTIASVNDSGLVTGISEGVAYFVFTDDSTGCTSDGSLNVTVQSGTEITLAGQSDICIGYTTTLSTVSSGFWSSNNPDVATITNSGVVTGKAAGKVSFEFIDAITGCISNTPDDIISVLDCINHDFNVTTVNLAIVGDISTNDNMALGTTYSASTVLISKPNGSNASLNVNSDGTYNFTANVAGNYRYNVPVCGPSQSAGCPTRMLEITVLDNIYSEGNPVANIDIASTYANADLLLVGLPINIELMANDKCVYTGGCGLDSASMNIISMPNNGTVTTSVLGNITYTPEAGYIGNDTIHYEICADGYANCNESMQIISIKNANANNSVVASDDFNYTIVGSSVSGNVKLNDSDPEGDQISIQPQGSMVVPIVTDDGSYFVDALGNYEFTPNSTFNGNTEITYTLCDDNTESACTDATLHILVFDDISLQIRLYLEGALMSNGNETTSEGKPMMRDDLRVSPFDGENSIPLVDPYSVPFSIFSALPSKYNKLGPHELSDNVTISDSLTVFSVTGDNAIVDWVHVELRSKDNMNSAFATRSGLIQRDGDVVDLDGVSPLRFQAVNVDSFYVVVKHRSHLGVMSQKVHYGTFVDFTDNDFPLFDFGTTKGDGYDYSGLAMKENYKSGYRACWAGDLDSNGKIKFSAPSDDQAYIFQDVLFSSPLFLINYDFAIGYYTGDFDMNSKAKYENPNDDKNHLFGQLLFYPLNTNFISNFDFFIEQVPDSE